MIFQYIGNWITELFDFLKSSSNTDIVKVLTTFIGLTITIQIMIKAYEVYAGKSSSPTRELIWDMTIKMILISIALNLNGFLDLIKLSMEELHNLMSGGKNLYTVLDEKLSITIKLIKAIWDKYSLLKSGSSIFITSASMFLIFLGFIIGIIPSFLIMVITDISLKLLMLVMPIVIFAKAYKWGKNIFDQWLSIFITNLLTVFIVGTLLNKFTDKYEDFITKANNNLKDTDILSIGSSSFILGIILLGLVLVAKEVAEKLGTVSLESISSKSIKDIGNYAKSKAKFSK